MGRESLHPEIAFQTTTTKHYPAQKKQEENLFLLQ